VRILVTGAGGMVGQNVIEHPHASKHELLTPKRSELDLADYRAVETYLAAHHPELIIHCAGRVGGILANLTHPVEYCSDNLEMGRNIVMAAYRAKVPKLINLGSSCMYPRNIEEALTEDRVLTGELEPSNEGYALAKIAVARLCQYISREKKGLSYRTLIPCNLYGRFDKFDPKNSHLIPAILHKIHWALKEGRKIVDIWGDGTARREFMNAADLADCIFHSIDRFEHLPEIMNVGVGQDHSVNDYYQAVADVIGFEGKFMHDLSKPVGMRQKLVSTERARALGWEAKMELNSGIAMAYEYYRTTGYAG
jgi:GDP-L-fucose synthase